MGTRKKGARKIRLRFYGVHDADLIAVFASGVASMAEFAKLVLEDFVYERDVHYVLDRMDYFPDEKQRACSTVFYVEDAEVLRVLDSLKEEKENAFIKTLMRNALRRQNISCFFKDSGDGQVQILQENRRNEKYYAVDYVLQKKKDRLTLSDVRKKRAGEKPVVVSAPEKEPAPAVAKSSKAAKSTASVKAVEPTAPAASTTPAEPVEKETKEKKNQVQITPVKMPNIKQAEDPMTAGFGAYKRKAEDTAEPASEVAEATAEPASEAVEKTEEISSALPVETASSSAAQNVPAAEPVVQPDPESEEKPKKLTTEDEIMSFLDEITDEY